MNRTLNEIKDYLYLVYRTSTCIFDYAKLGRNWIDKIGRCFTWLWGYHLVCFRVAHCWGYWLDTEELRAIRKEKGI